MTEELKPYPLPDRNPNIIKVLLRPDLMMPAIMLVVLWASINTGPYLIVSQPSGVYEYIDYVRALSPLMVLIILLWILPIRYQQIQDVRLGPATLWLIYGCIGLVSSLLSPKPLYALYWGALYLSGILLLYYYMSGDDITGRLIHINYMNWIAVVLFLILLLIVSRESLFVDSRWGGVSGYGIIHRVGTTVGFGFSRSSGMARIAAIPSIIALSYLLSTSGIKKFIWLPLFVSSVALVWLMQSRGAILGLFFAISVTVAIFSRKTRTIGIILAIVVTGLFLTDSIPDRTVKYTARHFYRGSLLKR